jgi:hypothetical protein
LVVMQFSFFLSILTEKHLEKMNAKTTKTPMGCAFSAALMASAPTMEKSKPLQ